MLIITDAGRQGNGDSYIVFDRNDIQKRKKVAKSGFELTILIFFAILKPVMKMKNGFTITEFRGALIANDATGRKIRLKSRYAACMIVTIQGRIRFTHGSTTFIVDKDHPIFLPQGYAYENECLEHAISYVFNFRTLEEDLEARLLTPVPEVFVRGHYKTIRDNPILPSGQNGMLVFGELYALAHRLFFDLSPETEQDKLLNRALRYITENYAESTLVIGDIAKACYISEIYLRKLFAKKIHKAPHQVLTEVRMRRAYTLASEKRPVKEIAQSVGYADVSQFSRAYKRYFGHTPSETAEN